MGTKLSSLVVTLVLTPLVWLSAVPAKLFVDIEQSDLANGNNCVRTERTPLGGN